MRSTSFAPSRHAARSSEYRSASGSASARAGRSARRVGHHAVVEPRCQGRRREAGVAGRDRRLDATFELRARRAAVPLVGRLLARRPRPHRAVRRAVGGRVADRRRTPSGPSRSGRGRRVAPRAPGPGSDARSSHAEKSDEWRRCQPLSTTITSWFRASRTAGFESRSYFGPGDWGAASGRSARRRNRTSERGARWRSKSARRGSGRPSVEPRASESVERECFEAMLSLSLLRGCNQAVMHITLKPSASATRHAFCPDRAIYGLARLRAGLLEEGRDLLLAGFRLPRLLGGPAPRAVHGAVLGSLEARVGAEGRRGGRWGARRPGRPPRGGPRRPSPVLKLTTQ